MFDEFMKSMPENTYTYEREINIKNVDDELINSINEDIFMGEDVIKNIVINFTDELNIKAIITTNKFLDNDEINNLKSDIAIIFKIDTENVEINI